MKAKAKPTLSARDRILLLVLPGAMVLLIYSLFINRSHIGGLTKANQQLEKLRGQTGVVPMSAAMLGSETQRLKTLLAEVERQLAAFSDGGSDAMQRSESVVLVGALLRQHGMTVVEEGPSSKSANPTGRPLAKNALQAGGGNADSVWQVRFLGTWSGVRAALEELPRVQNSACLPLSLSMAEPLTPSPVREWTLRLRL